MPPKRYKQDDPVDVEAELVTESANAWLIFDGKTKDWVPKSEADNNGDGTFTMPYWLAQKKGFI